MSGIYQFFSGYFFWISITFFLIGILVQSSILFNEEYNKQGDYFKQVNIVSFLLLIFSWFLKPSGKNKLPRTLLILFRLSIVIVPVFLLAHNLLWKEFFGWSLPAGHSTVFDLMTIIVLIGAFILFIKAAHQKETSRSVFFLFIIISFLSGILSHYQVGGIYEYMLLVHIVSSEIMLIYSPFVMIKNRHAEII